MKKAITLLGLSTCLIVLGYQNHQKDRQQKIEICDI